MAGAVRRELGGWSGGGRAWLMRSGGESSMTFKGAKGWGESVAVADGAIGKEIEGGWKPITAHGGGL